jgi:hypothetical protein
VRNVVGQMGGFGFGAFWNVTGTVKLRY